MSAHRSAKVLGCGAITPLGYTALHLAMAIRAGARQQGTMAVAPFAENPPVESVRSVLDVAQGLERLVALLAPPLSEACEGLDAPAGGFPLLVAAPSLQRTDLGAWDGRALLARLAAESPVPIDSRSSAVVDGGSPAGARAFERALAWLERGHGRVIVAGADTFHHPAMIASLLARGLWAPGKPPSSHFAEAAGAVVLSRMDEGGPSACVLEGAGAAVIPDTITIPPRDADPSLQVTGRARRVALRRLGFDAASGGLDIERAPALTDTLASLLETTLASLDTSSTSAWTDADSAPIRMLEWSEVAVRALPPRCRVEHMVHGLGVVGAATAPVWAALWSTWASAGCAPTALAVMCCHDQGRERGVVAMRASTFTGLVTHGAGGVP